MFGLILYIALVGLGTGVQIHDKIQERKSCKRQKPQTPAEKETTSSLSSDSADSSGYTPILDSPDFYTTFGGY